MGTKLDGRVAIVTGAARGIGLGIAARLAESGAMVIVSDINEAAGVQAAEGIVKAGGKAAFIKTNVADHHEADALVQSAIEKFGGLHILVNNAGINRDCMLHKMTQEDWNTVIAVNLTGVFNCLRPAAIYMRQQEYGRIINISSAGWQGNVGQANYSAAKAGVIGLTKTAAKELGRKNITVNAIVPGFIDTEMTRGVPQKAWDIMVSKISMGYVGKPEDIGNMAVFLASDEASYVTGDIIEVGGGMVL